MTEEKELQQIDIEWEAEKICRWGAARAGVIVVAPLVGTMALMANEVYMIMRLGELRGVKLEESAVIGLLTSLGATFVGQTLITLIPIAPIQVPVGISVTYAVGKAANAWIKNGRPEDLASFKEVYDEARKEGMKHSSDFEKMDCKDTPLGDESRHFEFNELKEALRTKSGSLFTKIEKHADQAEALLSETITQINEKLKPVKEKSELWFSAQKWDQIRKGALVIPYEEITDYVKQSMIDSEFVFEKLDYEPPNLLRIHLKHQEHGMLSMLIKVEAFNVSLDNANTQLEIVDFTVTDNDFAQLVIELMGSQLIMAIVDLLIERVDINADLVVTKYEQGKITVNFTEALKESSLNQKKLFGRSIFDVVHFTSLEPQPQGVLVKAKTEFK